jgi:hypothetical protein
MCALFVDVKCKQYIVLTKTCKKNSKYFVKVHRNLQQEYVEKNSEYTKFVITELLIPSLLEK